MEAGQKMLLAAALAETIPIIAPTGTRNRASIRIILRSKLLLALSAARLMSMPIVEKCAIILAVSCRRTL